MQFRILGPLTAAWDGEALSLGGERQRALLALLLVHANEMVSTERLIEQLFDGARPGSAANADPRGGVPAAPGAPGRGRRDAADAPRRLPARARARPARLGDLRAPRRRRPRTAGSRRPGGGVGAAGRGAQSVAGAAARWARHGRGAPGGDQTPGGAAPAGGDGADRGRAHARPRRRDGRGAGAVDRDGAAPGAAARAADARALPLGAPGRGARRLQGGVRTVARRARADSVRRAPRAREHDPAPRHRTRRRRSRAGADPPGAVPVQGAGGVRELRRGILLRPRADRLRAGRAAGRMAAGGHSRPVRDRQVVAASRRRAAGAAGRARCRAARGGARCCCDLESTHATSSGARSAGTSWTCWPASATRPGWWSPSTS